MSAEEGSAQPPTAGTDKAAPKAAATFSSFINKNTTGKKFAPKAARRRPGAAPAAAAPKSTATEPTAPSSEAQTPQAEPESSNAAEEPPAAVQLPTPDATQEPITQDAPQPTSASAEATTVVIAPTTTEEPVSTATDPLPTPATTVTEALTESQLPHETPATQTTQDVQDGADTGRAKKRRRMGPPAPKRPAVTEPTTEAQVLSEPQQGASADGQSEQAAAGIETQSTETSTEQQVTEETTAPRPRKRRTLPWNAVNRRETAEEEAAPAPAKKTRKAPKPRGKKQAATAEETEETEQQEGAEGSEAPPVRKRLSAKARGKRRADATDLEDGEEAPAPAKRTKRPRKVKSKAIIVDSNAEEDGAEQQPEEGEEVVVRRKPRQPRKKRRAATEGEVEDGQDDSQPKRRGRPPREPTPFDVEDEEIDPEITFMDSLASRNIRVGRLSNREKAMREIDWTAVRQRQREEDARPIQSKELREKADQLLLEEQPTHTDMPRIRLGADGQIEMIHASTTIDRDAQADEIIAGYEVQEEEDITKRITSKSFMKNNKRFPNDFLLPGQGKRWNADDTEQFYQGLRSFGTDFQMISHMFPGASRRSIKLKFTREERDNPDLVREALLGQSQIVSHWDEFMEVSQMDEARFADADRINRELAEEEAIMREQIDAAKAETKERKRQQFEAGMIDAEGNEINPDGTVVEKGKNKRKGKGKRVAFQEEAGVEVLGAIDEDERWGQE